MNSKEVRKKIADIGIVACARVQSPEHAWFSAETLYAAAIPIIEIPLTLPEAPEVIHELGNRYPDLVVGAGTVLDEQQARRCVELGARFLTSPGFVPEVVAYARKVAVVTFPGALTPSEVIAAWKAGADFVKIFPAASAGGTHYVRSLKIPLPQIPLIITGGVNQLTAFDYVLAGASAVGIGKELLPKEALVRRQDYRIKELAQRFLKMVEEAREQRASGFDHGSLSAPII
jgi:2-dehydro-3-deoxyphosphogluconate aldolase / (4S)-4-hydroxy-2-oxoglutarate aldolase